MAVNNKPAGKKSPEKNGQGDESAAAGVTGEIQTDTEVKADGAKKAPAKNTAAQVKRGPSVGKVSDRRANAKREKEEDPEEKIESAIGRTEQYIYDNGKKLLTILVVLVLIVGGFLAYKYLYMGHRSEKAGAAMFAAQQQFEIDSFEVALFGDGNYPGFLEVIEKYGGTPEGNIAKHYAGVCYLYMDDLDNALDYLQKYKSTKGVPNGLVNAQNVGLQGDIYVQKGEYAKAEEKFRSAVEISDNSLTTPVYLKKLALVYAQQGKHEQAKEAYQRITDDFPASMEARDVEKYIGGEEQK